MRIRLLALLLCALLLPALAAAQLRPIPDSARRGYLTYVEGPVVEIDGQRMHLAPGAQIRGENNLIVMPMSLPPGVLVKYTLDKSGEIYRVWALTPEEAAAPDRVQQ